MGILATTQAWHDLFILLPLSISGFSLVLSLFNVLLDFSGMLQEAEAEKRIKDEILQKGDAQRQAQRKRCEDDMQTELDKIEADFQHKRGAADITEKNKKIEDVMHNHFLAIEAIEQHQLDALRADLQNYRMRLQGIKDAVRGKNSGPKQDEERGSMAEFKMHRQPFEKQKEEIARDLQERIGALDPTKMSAEDFKAKMAAITDDCKQKTALVDEQLRSIEDKFRGGETV